MSTVLHESSSWGIFKSGSKIGNTERREKDREDERVADRQEEGVKSKTWEKMELASYFNRMQFRSCSTISHNEQQNQIDCKKSLQVFGFFFSFGFAFVSGFGHNCRSGGRFLFT